MNFKAVLITAWIWFPALATAYGTEKVCKSPECTERVKLLNESLNTTVDPCTDFYSHVCGRWESNHNPPPNGRNSYDVYQEIRKDIPEMLSYILGNRTLVESNQTIVDKLTIMYNACLANSDTRHSLIRILNESGFNAWPYLNKQNIFNSSNCTDLLHHMSISTIIFVHMIDMKLYARNWEYPFQITLERNPVPANIMKVANTTEVISNTMKFLNPGMDSLTLENLTNQLVEFAKNMSKTVPEYNPNNDFTISKLETVFGSNIPIKALLKKEFEKVNITLNDTETVNVYNYYGAKLRTFLDTADPNTFYNFAGFMALFPYLQYVQMSNERELTMSTTKSRNWRECITLLDKSASDILDYLYVSNQPNHTAIKKEVEAIAIRLKQTFNETLQNNSWIDNQTREALERKLKEVRLGIGYPDMLLNMSVLETRYQYVPDFLLNISFAEALYYITENSYKTGMRKFRYPKEGDLGWESSARNGRTYHDKYRMRKMEIPYALFVSPFFQQGLPRSLNYGGIGGAIANELADGFSDTAIYTCQKLGKCKWRLTDKSYKYFTSLVPCYEGQYKAANEKLLEEFSKAPWFWRQTSDQDLADNIGLQTAFNAYKKVLEDECAGIDTSLTGLENLSGMRLFFISHARTMCQIADKAARLGGIWRGYSPVENRVNEAVKNFKGFAEAFNCSPDSPMNPGKNCTLW